MKIKVLGSESACGTSSGNGSNFGSATHVRVFNDSTTNYLVSVEDSSNSLIGTFHLAGGSSEIIVKNPSDEVFAENAAVMGVGIAIEQ
mgnify:CR=1 FL=1